MPPEPIAASDRVRRGSGATGGSRRRARRGATIAGPIAGPFATALLATALLCLAAGPALAGSGAHPDDGDGCPLPPCACVVHLAAVQVAPPETPTTAATPTVAGRIAAERRSARADRPCAEAHRPRGPPSRDDA